jgi:hypothetical protein
MIILPIVWPRDHYMLLQRSTTGVCHALLWFPEQMVPTCSAKVKLGDTSDVLAMVRPCTAFLAAS